MKKKYMLKIFKKNLQYLYYFICNARRKSEKIQKIKNNNNKKIYNDNNISNSRSTNIIENYKYNNNNKFNKNRHNLTYQYLLFKIIIISYY